MQPGEGCGAQCPKYSAARNAPRFRMNLLRALSGAFGAWVLDTAHRRSRAAFVVVCVCKRLK